MYLSNFKEQIMIELKMNKEEPTSIRITEIIYSLLSRDHKGAFPAHISSYKKSYNNLVLCYSNHTYIYENERSTNFHKKAAPLKIDAKFKSLSVDLYQTFNEELIKNNTNTKKYYYNISKIAAEKASKQFIAIITTQIAETISHINTEMFTTQTKIYLEDYTTVSTNITESRDIRGGRSRRQVNVEDNRVNTSFQSIDSHSVIGYLSIAGVLIFLSFPAFKYFHKKRYRHSF
ncbi:hypothetical protein RF11_09094 [Thelohanellus kitauei]|uniref:Uncharacterized protein n=1 Tax=Thelohanellus kitauei TaxID=669202 RepID=A0A0C2MUN2_THEKT|nr:hypothetical protein RF11_09094 [Thelohanellus kitauei]